VTQEWSLQLRGTTVVGIQSPGHVALVESEGSLRIILSRRSFGNLISRRELSEKLCEFLEIPEARASYLSDVLSDNDDDTLRMLLDRYGIPQLAPTHAEGLLGELPINRSAKSSSVPRATVSKPKRSKVLIIEEGFDGDDHIHVTRHIGASGCKPIGPSAEESAQKQGTAMASSMVFILASFQLLMSHINSSRGLSEVFLTPSSKATMILRHIS
jgi:hypothetical protein